LALVALTEARGGASRPAAGGGEGPRTEPRVDRIVLPNGLTVVLLVDHRSPLVGMELRYRTGRRDDPAGRPGLTILVQNLMVRSTAHLRDGDYARYLDTAGAWDSRWLVNDDRTAFRVTVPSNQIALPLWMWSDQMGFFADRLAAPEVAAELVDLQHRWAESRANKHNGSLSDLVTAELYPPGHPYRMDVFPNPGVLNTLPVGELRAFVQAHYGPDRAILTLVGDFDPARARELLEKYFGSLRPTIPAPADAPPHPAPPRNDALPSLVGEIRLRVEAPVDFPSVTIVWPTAPLFEPGDAELDLIAEMLTGKRVGILYGRVVDQLKIASTVWAHQYSHKSGSEFWLSATATRGHTSGELVEAIDQLLRGVQSEPPTARNVAGALTGFLFDKVLAFEHYGVSAEAYSNCEEFAITGGCLGFHTSRYVSLDGARLSAVAASALPLRRRVVVEVIPAADAPPTGLVLRRWVVPQ
jgi:zinc protease